MIELRGVTKRFGALQVLDGVDLSIAPGRVTAVVGPNGAGKTTLIKRILGLTRIDAGSIAIDGRAHRRRRRLSRGHRLHAADRALPGEPQRPPTCSR